MYAQMVETGQQKVRGVEDMSPEEQAFQARVDADIKVEHIWLGDIAEENGIYLDSYRFETLDYFLGMAERIKFQEAV